MGRNFVCIRVVANCSNKKDRCQGKDYKDSNQILRQPRQFAQAKTICLGKDSKDIKINLMIVIIALTYQR